ncbi:hypothetical protein BY996DRAFT_6523811 [Phakopsora pachyrhizi]|nr:hypothetical protein BY996DRAFT_6523811 [Phakopsora pachyrhizi]
MIVLNLDYRLRSDFFKIWVSRLLPSFNFDRDRLKKRFFRDWVLILRLKEIRDLAILRDRKQVLKEAFRRLTVENTSELEALENILKVFKKQMTISSIKQQAAETERFNELQEKETSSEGDIIVSDRDQKIEEVEEVMRYDEEEDGGGGEDDQTVVGDFSENVVVDDPSLETTTTDGGTESDIDIALKNPRRSQWFPRRGRGRSILTSEERVEERVEEPDRKVNSISNRNLILKGLRSFDQSNRGFKNS